jgi:hypothetical protein
MMVKRIQRKRIRGWRMPEGAVYVGRPTKWGNPYRVGEFYVDNILNKHGEAIVEILMPCDDAQTAVRYYEEAIRNKYPIIKFTIEDVIRELRGRDLVCWCPLNQPCHADILLKIANGEGE